MKSNITLSLYNKIPVVLLALLNNVIEKLTGNIKLPTPPVSLTVMQTLADAYEQAVEDAQFGSQASKAARNALTLEVRAVPVSYTHLPRHRHGAARPATCRRDPIPRLPALLPAGCLLYTSRCV